MFLIETIFSPLIPLSLIEDFITEYFGWEKGSFSAVELQYSDNESKVFLDHPTDLLIVDVEKLLMFFHEQIVSFNNNTKPHDAVKPDIKVNRGALNLALNVLRRSGKIEVANELELTAQPLNS